MKDVPRRCPVCCAVERTAGVYLCGYRDDGTGRCWDVTDLAIRAIGREALRGNSQRRKRGIHAAHERA